ncbi:hypothetical protein F5Y14DRAFT_466282 [Nemania sp. NC0429]|nr:hypothetical protein F5Y14DRAFT_387404 [Nemania sp. NC0429]KAI1109915.1 hypothetical protein F5Y14DRAFT_466282 [Nemania sp. NC0429]
MRRADRPGPGALAPHSRSDSFVRMLELEKICKMKRVQQDHESSSISSSIPPRASSSLGTANPPTLRSRRASEYPPLSHQTQIMKAVRRSAALPTLSVSIPPSPTQATAMKPEMSVAELSLAREERAKTVTFSEPEDEELSDDSSICQSPSWEQYGQKKKKSKKGSHDKSTKRKEDLASKKKSNRLTKSPPIEQFAKKSLTSSERPTSALELSIAAKSDAMNPLPSTAEARPTQGGHQALRNDSGSLAKDKPKSRGFLSAFRLTHGNVTAVQKLVEAHGEAEKSVENHETLRSIQYETIPVQQQRAVRRGNDQNVPQLTKAPSIRSVISTSDHSLSSQEKRGSAARTSTGSGHGRSQSLLSSTLNKLRGPSYLYYQPSGEGSTSGSSKHSGSTQDINSIQSNVMDMSSDGVEKPLAERHLDSFSRPEKPSDFTFPPKNKRANTEPGPEIAPRGRQPRSRKVEIQSYNVEQEVTVSNPSDGQRTQTKTLQVQTQDAVMARITAQERQSQAARASQQTRFNIAKNNQTREPTNDHQGGGVAINAKRSDDRDEPSEVRRSENSPILATKTSSAERLAEREGKMMTESSRNVGLEIRNLSLQEDDQISVGTYASTIRPASRSHDGLAEGKRQLKPCRADGLGPHTQGMESWRFEDRSEAVNEKSVDDLITFDRDAPDTLQQPLQPYRETDYFASFSDSYLPPLLDLRLPNDEKLLASRSTLSEESDDDNGYDALHDHLQHINPEKIAVVGKGERMAAHAIVSNGNRSGRTPNEQKQKSSPAISTQSSDSDVPAFERLGLSSKAATVLGGVETASTSTTHSQQTEPSRATSERSSSSTYGDSPPSPSSASTPDSSRPQSRKGVVIPQSVSPHGPLLEPVQRTESRALHENFRNPMSERSEGAAIRKARMDTEVEGDIRGRAASKTNTEQQKTPTTVARPEGLTIRPTLVATPTSVSFAAGLRQDSDSDGEPGFGQRPVRLLPPKAHSALDLHSTTKIKAGSAKPQRLHLKQNGATSSASLPSSPPPGLADEVVPRKSALKASLNNSTNGPEPLTSGSMGAAYLQEARKAAASSSRALRPHFSQNNSSGSIRSAASTGIRAEPLAKMLVECCNCHFFHDMPSRVYECMAKPDSVVEDKSLGVSAAITTMVRCPWCAHGMTTRCCSGYAAVVYLKEKLHGK